MSATVTERPLVPETARLRRWPASVVLDHTGTNPTQLHRYVASNTLPGLTPRGSGAHQRYSAVDLATIATILQANDALQHLEGRQNTGLITDLRRQLGHDLHHAHRWPTLAWITAHGIAYDHLGQDDGWALGITVAALDPTLTAP